MNAAFSVLEHVIPLLDSGQIYTNNFVSVYLTALTIKIAGFDVFNPWASRLPSVFFGTLLIPLVYFLSKKVFENEKAAFFSAFLIAFSYLEIAWSRQVRGYAALAFFITIALYHLWNYLLEAKTRNLLIFFVYYVLACLSHWAALTFTPSLLLVLVIKKQIPVEKLWGKILFFTLFVIPPLILLKFKYPVSGGIFLRYAVFPFFPIVSILFGYIVVRLFEYPSVKGRLVPKLVLAGCVAIIVFMMPLQLIPLKTHELYLQAPQPDFNKVFSIILNERESDDVVITLRPVLSRLYLGSDGLWLSLKSKKVDEIDMYVGAKPLVKSSELMDVINFGSGFIVVDGHSFFTILLKKYPEIFEHPKLKLRMYSCGAKQLDCIWLYRF